MTDKSDNLKNVKNKSMSDEERLQLAAKLDKELDEFIDGLEKRQYTEGWPEDKWEEEMAKHPFFMKKPPEPGDELHPLLEGLQQLKYDPEENTQEELAQLYKDDGNFNYQYKKYRLAIISYTEGIKHKHENKDLLASLYNNRAASHYFLKNFRSCLRDCELALKLKPNYQKVIIRAAQTSFELKQWEKCINYCNQILEENSEDTFALKLRQKVITSQKAFERDLRKRQKTENEKIAQNKQLLDEIKKRGVKLTSDSLKPNCPQLEDATVYLDSKNNELIWPVALVYPEFGVIDFIREFPEQNTFCEQLKVVLSEPASWDPNNRYKIDKVNIYFEEINGKAKINFVNIDDTLSQTLSRKEFFVKDATPHFFILEKGSPVEIKFLKSYQ